MRRTHAICRLRAADVCEKTLQAAVGGLKTQLDLSQTRR